MRRPVIIVSVLALVLAGVGMLLATEATAAARCRFTPVLPRTIAIGKSVVPLDVRLHVAGPADCFGNGTVSTTLAHKGDALYLLWQTQKINKQRIYAGEVVPGAYATTSRYCDAYDKNFHKYSCSVTTAHTTIKFAAHPSFTATRSGSSLRFKVVAKRFFEFDGFKATRAMASVQRHTSKGWTTVHTALANGRPGYTWTYRHAPRVTYRVVSGETQYAFRGYSASLRR